MGVEDSSVPTRVLEDHISVTRSSHRLFRKFRGEVNKPLKEMLGSGFAGCTGCFCHRGDSDSLLHLRFIKFRMKGFCLEERSTKAVRSPRSHVG